MLGGGTMADIVAAWDDLSKESALQVTDDERSRYAGVGQVQVLRENDYAMGEDMPNAQHSRGDGAEKKLGRQVAGRDFLHEERCLSCWEGPDRDAREKLRAQFGLSASIKAINSGVHGGLRGCDLCPAAFHLKCCGIREADAIGFGVWACPHHACHTCGRKASAVGGLLFRCSVCPKAFCEDHLPSEALIMGENPRFQALGHSHPNEAATYYTRPPASRRRQISALTAARRTRPPRRSLARPASIRQPCATRSTPMGAAAAPRRLQPRRSKPIRAQR